MLGLVLGLLGLLYYSTVNRKAVSRIRKKGTLLCKLSYIKNISVLFKKRYKSQMSNGKCIAAHAFN